MVFKIINKFKDLFDHHPQSQTPSLISKNIHYYQFDLIPSRLFLYL